MFNIGDKIVYPVQGVGVIDLIEEKEFNGEMQTYYKINIVSNSLRLLLPSSRLKACNIRLISDPDTLDNVLNNIPSITDTQDDLCNSSCKERISVNNDKIKSGTLIDYIQVISTLSTIKKQHTLNASESQMLKSTRKVLIDEISLTKNVTTIEAQGILDSSLNLA